MADSAIPRTVNAVPPALSAGRVRPGSCEIWSLLTNASAVPMPTSATTATTTSAARTSGPSGAGLAPSSRVAEPDPPAPTPEAGQRYPELPETKSLGAWRDAAAHCRACDLWKNATQTVFGDGRQTAKVVFVGEQPGDKEDIAGKPFVGPAGRVLDEALEAAGIERDTVYVTNAVKHLKWRPAGKRRLHEKPNRSEISACQLWLDAQIGILQPQAVY